MNKPKAVLFDLGDTILGNFSFDPLAGNIRLLDFVEDRKGVDLEDIKRAAQAIDQELKPLRESSLIEFTVRHFNQLLFDRFNIAFKIPPDVMEMEFWKGAASFSPEPGISEVLKILKACDIKMGVVSNSSFSSEVLSWELQHHGLLDAFEFVLSSADCGVRKPHPLIFLTAVSKLGFKPSEVWFVGDMLQFDIAGARQAGLGSIWYNKKAEGSSPAPDSLILHNGPQGDSGRIIPDVEVKSWSEFVVLVQEQIGRG